MVRTSELKDHEFDSRLVESPLSGYYLDAWQSADR